MLRGIAKAREDTQGSGGSDTATPEHISYIVSRWTSIPVTALMLTEEMLLHTGRMRGIERGGEERYDSAVREEPERVGSCKLGKSETGTGGGLA